MSNRKNRIRPVGGAEITDYRGVQDAYYPALGLLKELKAETGLEYEMVGESEGDLIDGRWTYVGLHTYVAVRTDEYGVKVSPDATDPATLRRHYERTLPPEEQNRLAAERMFNLRV